MDNKELISQEKLISLLNNYCIPRLDGELRFSSDGYFYYRFPREPVLTGRRYISVTLKDDHYEIYNEIQIVEGRAHIQIFNDHIECIDGSTYCDFTRDDMISLYTFLDKGIFGIKEEENAMNDKKLIPQNELTEIIFDYIVYEMQELLSDGKQWNYDHREGFFEYVLCDKVGTHEHNITSKLWGDHWSIYTDGYANDFINIRIFDNRVEFVEGSIFNNAFDKDSMCGLYEKLKSYIEDGGNIKEETKDDENVMNNNKKELMPQEVLTDIMYNYIKPVLDECTAQGGEWVYKSKTDKFYWGLFSGIGDHDRFIGARLCDDRWQIYNEIDIDENVNIEIYSDKRVTFHANSEFNDFDIDFMNELYMKIIDYIQGDNEDDNEEKDNDNNIMENITNDILKYDDKVKKPKNRLFISSPMSNVLPDSVRRLRNRIHQLVKIMIHDPDLELIDQYDVDESDVDFSGMNENQIRQYRLHRSLSMMKYANVIAFGDYWWESPGCIEEYIEASLYMQGVLKIMMYDLRLLENNLYDSTPDQNMMRIIHKFEQNRVNQIDNLLLTISSNRKPPFLPDGYSPELKVAKLLCDLKSNNQEFNEYGDDDSETDMTNNVEGDSSIIEQDNSHYTFDQYIKEHCEDDVYNNYWYALLIHNKLLDIMENVMFDKFGDGNTSVTTEYKISICGNFVAYTTFAPINHNKECHVITSINSTKNYNEEWCSSRSEIKICNTIDGKQSIPFKYQYVPSQEGPETDDRITNQVLVDYIGSAHIPHSDRKMFSRINSEFKAFIKDRDDIVWKKDK